MCVGYLPGMAKGSLISLFHSFRYSIYVNYRVDGVPSTRLPEVLLTGFPSLGTELNEQREDM